MKRTVVVGAFLGATLLAVEWRGDATGEESMGLSVSSTSDARKKRHRQPPPPPAAPTQKAQSAGNPELDAMLNFVRANFGQLKNLLNKAQEQVKAGKPVDELLSGGGTGQSPAQSPTPAAPTEPAAPSEPAAPTPEAKPATPAPPAAPAAGGAKKQLQQAKKALAKLAKQHINAAKPVLNQIKNDVLGALGIHGKLKVDSLVALLAGDQFFNKLKTAFNALTASVQRNFPQLRAAFMKFVNEAKDLPQVQALAGRCNDLLGKIDAVVNHCGKTIRALKKFDPMKIKKEGKPCAQGLIGAYPAFMGCYQSFKAADQQVAQVEQEPDL